MKKILLSTIGCLLVAGLVFPGTAAAQDDIYSASADMALVSKYIWRGQRLTNDWSLQPSMTIGIEGFAFNAWATMDLTQVNPSPLSGIDPGDGMQGHFSEVDYTFSYDASFENASVGGGVIFYAFPDRFATTTEIYGTISADSAPLAPSFTLYVDVDETNNGGGSTGLYFLIAAGHTFEFNHNVFTGIDLSGSIAFSNSGFNNFYYGVNEGAVHDGSFSVSLPISINDNWSAGAFVTYSGLAGESIRASQFGDPRVAGGAGGKSHADTVWGGFSLSLSF